MPPWSMPTLLNAQIRRGKRRRFSFGIAGVLEFLHFFEAHPRLHPDLGFIQLLLARVDCLDGQMVHSAGNHLFLCLDHSHKLEQSILLLVVVVDGEASEGFGFGAVLGALGFANSAEGGHFGFWQGG